jgi:predicted signal transduction protein with EAL and GGDEF domain
VTTVDRAVRQVQGISAQRDAWVEVRYEVNQEHSVGHAYLATGNPKLRPALDQASRSLEAAFAELVAYGEPDDAAQARRLQARHAPQPPAAAADAGRGRRRGPAHGNDTAELLQHADVAMYAAKQTHSGFMVYDPTVDQHSPRRLALLGAEALVRWQHPDHGLLGPGEFIPLAERTGLIHPLTRWVLDAALRQAAQWHRDGHRLSVAVNVPPAACSTPASPTRSPRAWTPGRSRPAPWSWR